MTSRKDALAIIVDFMEVFLDEVILEPWIPKNLSKKEQQELIEKTQYEIEKLIDKLNNEEDEDEDEDDDDDDEDEDEDDEEYTSVLKDEE